MWVGPNFHLDRRAFRLAGEQQRSREVSTERTASVGRTYRVGRGERHDVGAVVSSVGNERDRAGAHDVEQSFGACQVGVTHDHVLEPIGGDAFDPVVDGAVETEARTPDRPVRPSAVPTQPPRRRHRQRTWESRRPRRGRRSPSTPASRARSGSASTPLRRPLAAENRLTGTRTARCTGVTVGGQGSR